MNRTYTHPMRLAVVACTLLALATGFEPALAQTPPPATIELTQPERDQMLAPVALYPDTLLAQVLMASTYPLQVVQAARFMDSHRGLQGDALAQAVAAMTWDPSVKSLSQFPSVLAMMNDRLDWTQRLGEAFLTQPGNLMDTVQNLRRRAQIAGTLLSNQQQRVVAQDRVIIIEAVNPELVYVPYYNPVVVYGRWWWPRQPPMVWLPPARFQAPSDDVGVRVGVSFGIGVALLHAVAFDAHPDWYHHQLMLDRTGWNNPHPAIWQHNQGRPDIGHAPFPQFRQSASMPPTAWRTGVGAATVTGPVGHPMPHPILHPAPAAGFAVRAAQQQHPEHAPHAVAPQPVQTRIALRPAPQAQQQHDEHPPHQQQRG